jgi:hypothetical protein
MTDMQKTYKISFHCKPIKKSETLVAFKEKVALLGDSFFISFSGNVPIITTSVSGIHEIHSIITNVESTCSTTVEFLGTDPWLL